MAEQLRKITINVLVVHVIALVCFICLISAEIYQLTKPRRTYFLYDKKGQFIGTRETDIPADGRSPLDEPFATFHAQYRSQGYGPQPYMATGAGPSIRQQSSEQGLPWKLGNDSVDLKDVIKLFGKKEKDFNYQMRCYRAPDVCGFQSLCASANDRGAPAAGSRNSMPGRFGLKERITNGQDADPGEFGEYARVIYTAEGSDQPVGACGGVLISQQHVLTAGHCVGPPEMLYPAEGYDVVLGDFLSSEKDPGEQHMKVEKVCRARKYTNQAKNVGTHDWAIITLRGEVEIQSNTAVNPGCLINEYEQRNVPVFAEAGAECYVMGFGSMKGVPYGEPPNPEDAPVVMQKMRVVATLCQDFGIELMDKSRTCFASVEPDSDSCAGDSGSPVLCKHKDGRMVVNGLVSYGRDNCNGPSAVFTDIPQLLPDIFRECL